MHCMEQTRLRVVCTFNAETAVAKTEPSHRGQDNLQRADAREAGQRPKAGPGGTGAIRPGAAGSSSSLWLLEQTCLRVRQLVAHLDVCLLSETHIRKGCQMHFVKNTRRRLCLKIRRSKRANLTGKERPSLLHQLLECQLCCLWLIYVLVGMQLSL